jgi:hypothetical protein
VSDAPHKLGHELFIDRTSSKRLINILRKAGFVLQTIFEVYPDNVHENVVDPDWIKKCGENNWIVITGDKRIETVPENRQAVVDAKVKVFLLNDSNSKPEVWAAAILLGQYKMQDIIDATTGPFFVTVGKRCDSHIQRPRRPAGYDLVAAPDSMVAAAPESPSVASVPDGIAAEAPVNEGMKMPSKPGELFN